MAAIATAQWPLVLALAPLGWAAWLPGRLAAWLVSGSGCVALAAFLCAQQLRNTRRACCMQARWTSASQVPPGLAASDVLLSLEAGGLDMAALLAALSGPPAQPSLFQHPHGQHGQQASHAQHQLDAAHANAAGPTGLASPAPLPPHPAPVASPEGAPALPASSPGSGAGAGGLGGDVSEAQAARALQEVLCALLEELGPDEGELLALLEQVLISTAGAPAAAGLGGWDGVGSAGAALLEALEQLLGAAGDAGSPAAAAAAVAAGVAPVAGPAGSPGHNAVAPVVPVPAAAQPMAATAAAAQDAPGPGLLGPVTPARALAGQHLLEPLLGFSGGSSTSSAAHSPVQPVTAGAAPWLGRPKQEPDPEVNLPGPGPPAAPGASPFPTAGCQRQQAAVAEAGAATGTPGAWAAGSAQPSSCPALPHAFPAPRLQDPLQHLATAKAASPADVAVTQQLAAGSSARQQQQQQPHCQPRAGQPGAGGAVGAASAAGAPGAAAGTAGRGLLAPPAPLPLPALESTSSVHFMSRLGSLDALLAAALGEEQPESDGQQPGQGGRQGQ